MRQKSITIKDKINDCEIELTHDSIELYKKETSHIRVTKQGIEKFFNNLIRVMTEKLIL
jgi:hypothetical protein